jgi:hypothetical protein
MDIAPEHKSTKSHEHTNILGFTNTLRHYVTANALKRENMIKKRILEATALKQERVTLNHERHQIKTVNKRLCLATLYSPTPVQASTFLS